MLDEGKYRAEVYRQRAITARHTADLALDEATRVELLRLAESWERLAEHKNAVPPPLSS